MTKDIFALLQAWRMAIQREQDAHDFYVRMAQTATDASAKALFETLAVEETKHKQWLEAEYRRVFERDLEEPRGRVGIFEHDLRDRRPAGIAWWDWEEETFRLAKELDVPILLSISAVWCHWCHVMDETSYANPEVAALINADFIPIRVDTDQRPDIKSRYNMGGWPTTAFLTPDGEVLTGATYVPPEEFKRLLNQVSDYYRNNKDAVQAKLSELEDRRQAAREARARAIGELSISIVEEVVEAVVDGFDPLHGGFGEAPKFPHAEALELALAEYWRTKDEQLLGVVTKTLSAMAQGGHLRSGDGRVLPLFDHPGLEHPPLREDVGGQCQAPFLIPSCLSGNGRGALSRDGAGRGWLHRGGHAGPRAGLLLRQPGRR